MLAIPPPKNNFFGISYVQHETEDDEYEAIFNRIFKKHSLQYQQDDEEEEKQKEKIKNRVFLQPSDFDDGEDYIEDSSKCRYFYIFLSSLDNKFITEGHDTVDDELLQKARVKRVSKSTLSEFSSTPELLKSEQKYPSSTNFTMLESIKVKKSQKIGTLLQKLTHFDHLY